jgi:hypothetical protein
MPHAMQIRQRPILLQYIQRRDALEASAKEALEARATSGSTILTI